MPLSRRLRAFATALIAAIVVLIVTAPQHTSEAPLLPPEALATPETAPLLLTLPEPLNRSRAQLSGLTWYADWLLLLPQYPDFAGDPALYAVARADLSAALEHPEEPLPVRRIPLHGLESVSELPGYEGFEAVAASGETLYFLVELRRRPMRTAIVRGQPADDLSGITLDAVNAGALVAPTELANLGYEALVTRGDDGFTALYEANGAAIRPAALSFDAALAPGRRLDMSPLPYRLTDATAADEEGRFWVMNYFFPGERALAAAPVAGGVTHAQYAHVERLVELKQMPRAVVRTATPPLYLRLADTPRNWEGVVRFDDDARRGFLLVSDGHPTTLLAYVAASPP